MERTFTPEQRAAIESTAKNILAVAGPGSGKTTTLVERIHHLVNARGYASRGIAVITFTNAAARDLQERLAEREVGPLDYAGTLHGLALRQLTRHGKGLGYGDAITVLDEEQAAEMLADIARKLACKAKPAALWNIRRSWKLGQKPGGRTKAERTAEMTVAEYLRELRRASAVDFDSLLDDFARLIETGAGAWEHLFVDEYQDTGDQDARIYATIAAANRFVVGDPDQAIYGFRGGRVGHIMDLAKDPTWEVHRLEGNFRCALDICAAANALITRNPYRIPKFTESQTGQPGTVRRISYESEEAERTEVLRNVQKLIGEGTPAADIAILARSNAVVNGFVKSAELFGVPVRKKVTPKVPSDWATARAAIELVNNPQGTLVARQFLRARFGADVAARMAADASKRMLPLHKMVTISPAEAVGLEGLPEAMARLGVSRESIERVQEFARELPHGAGLVDLSFAIARDFEHATEIGDGVTITTMHSSKGREWAVVYLVAFEDEIIPGNAKSRDVAEERRIAFVGITRAKTKLAITWAGSRRTQWGTHRPQPSTPSRFIAELSI